MPQLQKSTRKNVAVFFGGRSPEHDVSIVTGLQVLNAIDPARYNAFPVYITTDGHWLVGECLRERGNYMLDKTNRAQTMEVTLDTTAGGKGRLVPLKTGLFSKPKAIEFDIAMPAFHGLFGEDGRIQGLFELIGVPYTGMRSLACNLLMDKVTTKHLLKSLEIPALPYVALKRPTQGLIIPPNELKDLLGDITFPCILKPAHLGSSIGVAKVEDIEELSACLPAVFEYDDKAIIEPFVSNLVEYNVAVGALGDQTNISAIERPKTSEELLDFKEKYLAGGSGSKGKLGGGTKTAGTISEGMLSLTRELNPDLPADKIAQIKDWAVKLFETIDGTGAPRIDFIGNSQTGELWLNEVNPCPGSFGYFLWEAAQDSLLFSEFLTALLEEAHEIRKSHILPADPVPKDARLFVRR